MNLPKNVISSGINSTSQLNTIKKFLKLNEIEKTIFLTPDLDYKNDIKNSIKESKIKISKHFINSCFHLCQLAICLPTFTFPAVPSPICQFNIN